MIPTLKRGWAVITAHSKLWLILWLIIIFPAIFLYSFGQIEKVSQANITTLELSRISTLHDLLESLLEQNVALDEWLPQLKDKQTDISKLQIVSDNEDTLVIEHDFDSAKIGSLIENVLPYRSALIRPGETFMYEYEINGRNIKQAFRSVALPDKTLYIFTEHDFTNLDTLFQNRIERSYLVLSLIFVFIIILAYWLAEQINYQTLYRQSEARLQERDLFTNSLVHELRAPLTAMRGYASMIEEAVNIPATERAFAIKIKDSTARLVTLVNDFLEAARIQSGRLPLNKTKVNIGSLLHKVMADSELLAKNKGLRLSVHTPNEMSDILTDSKRVEQIVTNIVNNAIKYTKQGEITLTLEQGYKMSVITVADTGHGISAEDQRKLFTPFMRVGSTAEKESITGTGLGMWITKQLVGQLGGTIELESIKGVGTHVIVSLPNE